MIPILKSVITLVPDLITLFKKKTPKKGIEIANAGTALTAFGVTTFGATSAINPGTLDDISALIVSLTQLVAGISTLLGTVAILIGKSQVTTNENNEPK